jgi:hypothetical protein
MIEGIVSGAMGIQPSASQKRVVTLPQITGDNYLQVNNIPMLGGTVSVRHNDNKTSAFVNNTSSDIIWEAAFAGDYNEIFVNGTSVKAQKRTDAMGAVVSFAEVKLGKGEQACCCVE